VRREWRTEIVYSDSIDIGVTEALGYLGAGAVPVAISLAALYNGDQVAVTVLADVPEEDYEILRRPASPA
jgi:hypothetical protein